MCFITLSLVYKIYNRYYKNKPEYIPGFIKNQSLLLSFLSFFSARFSFRFFVGAFLVSLLGLFSFDIVAGVKIVNRYQIFNMLKLKSVAEYSKSNDIIIQ